MLPKRLLQTLMALACLSAAALLYASFTLPLLRFASFADNRQTASLVFAGFVEIYACGILGAFLCLSLYFTLRFDLLKFVAMYIVAAFFLMLSSQKMMVWFLLFTVPTLSFLLRWLKPRFLALQDRYHSSSLLSHVGGQGSVRAD